MNLDWVKLNVLPWEAKSALETTIQSTDAKMTDVPAM